MAFTSVMKKESLFVTFDLESTGLSTKCIYNMMIW